MEPSAVCALLCEADAARHTHQSWRWAGAPDPRRLPEWIAATLGVFWKVSYPRGPQDRAGRSPFLAAKVLSLRL